MKLCTHPDTNVRGMAFDALRSIGVTDVPGFVVAPQPRKRRDRPPRVRARPGFRGSPRRRGPRAHGGPQAARTEPIRVAAAEGLATSGTTAAPAAGPLAEAIRKSYPAEYDPEAIVVLGPGDGLLAGAREDRRTGGDINRRTPGTLQRARARAGSPDARRSWARPAKPAAGKLRDASQGPLSASSPSRPPVHSAWSVNGKDDAVELVKRALDAPNNVAQTAIDAIPRMGEAGKTARGASRSRS